MIDCLLGVIFKEWIEFDIYTPTPGSIIKVKV